MCKGISKNENSIKHPFSKFQNKYFKFMYSSESIQLFTYIHCLMTHTLH